MHLRPSESLAVLEELVVCEADLDLKAQGQAIAPATTLTMCDSNLPYNCSDFVSISYCAVLSWVTKHICS